MHDTCRRKSGATLLVRAYAMMAYVRWAAPLGTALPFPITEGRAYDYLKFLRSVEAAPTRAGSFLAAIPVANFILGIEDAGDVCAARVTGAAEGEWMKKRVRRPRDDFTASMLAAFEHLTEIHEEPRVRVFAGFVTAMTHWRCRFSDAMSVDKEPFIDTDHQGNDVFVEGKVLSDYTKNGQVVKRARREIHLVGLATGVRGNAWARAWLEAREEQGLDAGRDGCLMPTPCAGTFSKRPMTTEEGTLWMRELLIGTGFSKEAIDNIGTHTCKHTLLGWASKFVVPKDIRRDLGSHVNPGDKSIAAYSRDAMAGPMMWVERMVDSVSKGAFMPDATRSGRFAPWAKDTHLGLPAPVEPPKEQVGAQQEEAENQEDDDPTPSVGEGAAGSYVPTVVHEGSEVGSSSSDSDNTSSNSEDEESEETVSEGERDPETPKLGEDDPSEEGVTPLPADEEGGSATLRLMTEAVLQVIAEEEKDEREKTPIPPGGLWYHPVHGTLHLRGDAVEGGSPYKLLCFRRGLHTTYKERKVWPLGATRCKVCFREFDKQQETD